MNKIYFLIIFLIFLTPVHANQLPVAIINASENSIVFGSHVHFDASQSYDSDGSIVKYDWDFNDGYTSSGVTVMHYFSNSGEYNIRLTVTDNKGNTSTTTKFLLVLPIKVEMFIPRDKFYSFGWDPIGNMTVHYDKKNSWSEAGYDYLGFRIRIPEIGFEKTSTMLIKPDCKGENPDYCTEKEDGVTERPLWVFTDKRMNVNPTSAIVDFYWRGYFEMNDYFVYNKTYTVSIEESVPEGVPPFEIVSFNPTSEMYMVLDGGMMRYYSYANVPIEIHINAKNYHYLCTSGSIYGTCWGTFGPDSSYRVDSSFSTSKYDCGSNYPCVRIEDSLSPNYFTNTPPTSDDFIATVTSGTGGGNVIYNTSKNWHVNYKPGSIIYIYSKLKQNEFTSSNWPIGGVQITADQLSEGKTYTANTHTSFLGPPGTWKIKLPKSVDKYFRYIDWSNQPWFNEKIYFSRWNDNEKLNEKTITLNNYGAVSYDIFYAKDFNDTCFKDLGKNCEYCGCPTDYSCDAPTFTDRCHRESHNCNECGCHIGNPVPTPNYGWRCNQTNGQCYYQMGVDFYGRPIIGTRLSPICTLYENASTCSSADERLIDYTCTDIACISSLFDCNNIGKSCSSGSCQEPLYCSDGTQIDQCSVTKPKYCDNGILINKCSFCGCPTGQLCNTTSEECYIPLKVGLVPIIKVSSERANVNENIHFDASSSYDTDGIITSYYWDFTDGTNSSDMIVDHSFSSPGVYEVFLKCEDNKGRSEWTSVKETIGSTSSTCSECAYVAASYDGLYILDISNPSNPKLVGNYSNTNDPVDVQVSGQYAYMSDLERGLLVLDISNPFNPRYVSNYSMSRVLDIQLSGHYIYALDSDYGLYILDISNPYNPTLASRYEISYPYGLYVSGQYAYIGSYDNNYNFNFLVIDISNPSQPTIIGNYTLLANGVKIIVSGHYAYMTDQYEGIKVFDISNPYNPKLVGNSSNMDYAYDIQISGQYAFVTNSEPGLTVLDISNPSSPTIVGNYDMYNYGLSIQISGNYVYMTDGYFIYILDISNPSSPILISKYGLTNARDIFIKSSIINQCSDGTLYSQCSITKPKYCDNGNLINKCTQCSCPSGQTCNTTSEACYTPVTNQITLQSGWNMFSLPIATNADSIRSQCGTTNTIWHYNPSTSRYESATTIEPGKGYWIKLSSTCTISSLIGTESYPSLKAGWNQIGAFTSIVFNNVKGDCNVLAGPWKYNPSTARYELSSTLEPGYGYWVKVSNDCSLG